MKIDKNLILIAIASALLMAGLALYSFFRADPASSPSEALSAFHESIKAGEIDDTKRYITADINAAFESGRTPWYVGSFGEFIKDHQQKYKSIEPLSESIHGETAMVKANVTYKDNSSEIKEYLLIKEDGEWKIAE